ncbi:MAG: hypothetical protein K0S07_564 [Chlamydiales bacterium]|jgi:hypothetical protein|nr:hypothetical protein [Chlamydiales bacterium]
MKNKKSLLSKRRIAAYSLSLALFNFALSPLSLEGTEDDYGYYSLEYSDCDEGDHSLEAKGKLMADALESRPRYALPQEGQEALQGALKDAISPKAHEKIQKQQKEKK